MVKKVGIQEKTKSKLFLAHFPVVRPDKAPTKTGIVFDASAKCGDISLNDMIHQGPNPQQLI